MVTVVLISIIFSSRRGVPWYVLYIMCNSLVITILIPIERFFCRYFEPYKLVIAEATNDMSLHGCIG